MRATLTVFLCLTAPAWGSGGEKKEKQEAPVLEPRHDVIVVTGTFEPVPLEESDRPVRVFEIRSEERLLSNTLVDFLQLDPSIDLRQRGPGHIQGDLSIRGSTYAQTLVLIDGMRMNDVQTGHHNMNLPLPMESLERIEVLKGSGSAFYGSDAVGGVVNFITKKPEVSEFRLRTGVGNWGRNQQRGSLALVRGSFAEQITFFRDFSTGFMENRDYRNLSLTSRTEFLTPIGGTRVFLAHADRPFGAEQYYGNFNSWERTKAWVAAARQDLGERTNVSFSFRRHTDLFVLFRDRPGVFTNRHATESYQAAVRRWEPLGVNGKLHYGAEGLHEAIESNNLGSHTRARGAGFVAMDLRAWRRFFFSAGGRLEVYGTAQTQFSPTAAAGAWLTSRIKFRASVSRAFRVPTYTELYYHDPANRGSPDLRPESAWNYEAGIDWNWSGRLRGEVTVFQRRERDVIDWVRTSPGGFWRATNFQRLRFTGLEAGVTAAVRRLGRLDVRYTALHGAQRLTPGYASRYVFNYPRHYGVAGWQTVLPGGLALRSRFGGLARYGQEPYAVWDVYAARVRGRIHPFVQLTNLTGASYQEIPGVAMPGRGILAGVEIAVFGSDAAR